MNEFKTNVLCNKCNKGKGGHHITMLRRYFYSDGVCIMVHLIYCSLFSMDGDFAPMVELAELRKKHGFLLVIDDVRPLIGLFCSDFFFF